MRSALEQVVKDPVWASSTGEDKERAQQQRTADRQRAQQHKDRAGKRKGSTHSDFAPQRTSVPAPKPKKPEPGPNQRVAATLDAKEIK
jgi:hypothetical protein